MAETTIGNLTLGAVDGTSMFEQERTVNGSQVSEKVLSSSVANFVGTSHQFAGLSTTAKNLVGAINEAASSGGASVVQLTQAEYDLLTTEQKMNGSIYKLTDKAIFYCLDEEYHAVKEIASADYALLTSAEKNNGTLYVITDEETTGEDIPVNTLTPDTSINSAINACFGRTGSDIAVSDFDNASIAEKLATIPTSESVPITFNSSQSDYSIPYNNTHVEKYGKVVSVSIVPKCVNSYSAYPGQLVYTGLPAPKEILYYTFNSPSGTGKIRLSIDTSGNLYLRWGKVNDEYDCTFTYVCR